MTLRAAFLVLCASTIGALPAYAQGPGGPGGPGGPPPSYPQLAAQIADLQARVGKLEGNITAADLVGSYAVSGLDIPMSGFVAGAPPQAAAIKTFAFAGTLTLTLTQTDGGAASFISTCEGSRLTQGTWLLTSVDCTNSPTAGTWSYANGIFSLSLGQFQAQGSVAAGGRLWTTAMAPFHAADPSSDALIIIASRLK